MKNKFISFNSNVPTAWNTLIVLVAGFIILLTYTYAFAYEIEHDLETKQIQEGPAEVEKEQRKEVRIITTQEFNEETRKQSFLADLRWCESRNNDFAVGDNGMSIGPYQWQKQTLEDKIGRIVSYDEYYSIVTDYPVIHELTYKTYFEDGETWRWTNCRNKING